MGNRLCKSCGKPLPDQYKHKTCEGCRNKAAEKLKDAGRTALRIGTLIGGTVIAVVLKGKINPSNKQ